jgi:hypothetical protein
VDRREKVSRPSVRVIGINVDIRVGLAALEQSADVTIGRAACDAGSARQEIGCELGIWSWPEANHQQHSGRHSRPVTEIAYCLHLNSN